MKDNFGNPRSLYFDKLVGMDNRQLFKECKDKIWLSAYAHNNPRSDYHWQCDACYDECNRRGKESIYQAAHDYLTKNI